MIGESDSDGRLPTFTARPDDELKLRKDGFRDTRLVVRSREIEIHRTPNPPTTNPIANVLASFFLEGMIEDTVPIEKGQPVVIEMKPGKASTQLLNESAQEVLARLMDDKLRRDMVQACIQIYPWKVQFPYVESENASVELSFP